MAKINYMMLLITLALIVSIAGCSKKQGINFNGYYSNKKDFNKVHVYFRFYADGTVTSALPVPVNNNYTLNIGELDKDNIKECTIRGKYSLKGNEVVFKLVDKNGSADFSGEFKKNKLDLKVHSNIYGKDSYDSYDFYPYKW